MNILEILVYQPTFNLLFLLYKLLWSNLGLAIIVLAIIVKTLTIPMMNGQKKMAQQQKDTQAQLKEIKIKYKDQPEQLLKEQMKLQKGMLSGLGGCLFVIITIVLFLQIRSSIIDLTNQGWHAFNKEAYVESWKQPEDSLKMTLPNDLTTGKHTLSLIINLEDRKYIQDITFWIYSNDEEKKKFETESTDFIKQNSTSHGQLGNTYGSVKVIADSGDSITSVYSTKFLNNFVTADKSKQFDVYFRYPFNAPNDKKNIVATLDSLPIENFAISKGEWVNLNILGIDLSKTAIEVAPGGNLFTNILSPTVLPYVILALIVGISQVFSMRYMTATKATDVKIAENIIEGEVIEEEAKAKLTKNPKKKQELEKDAKEKSENEKDLSLDMAKTMEDMTSSMGWIFGSLSILTSLGLLGGSQFFPAGLSIYWTAQSLYDIIRGVYTEKFKSAK